MRRLRYLVLAALGVFAALPVAQVYTSGAPWIEKMELRNNDLVALQGKGVPGTQIGVYYKQRNFRQGYHWFEWCNWLNQGNAILLGSAQVTGAGTWRLQGLDTQILPGAAEGQTCATGVLTQVLLYTQYDSPSVPELVSLNLWNNYYPYLWAQVGAEIEGANQVAIGLADGPNDVTDAVHPWPIDTDEDGADLCENGTGCGAHVSWGGVGPFATPNIRVQDDSPLVGPRDQEFGHVMGMLQGHKPGGSILAVGYVPRPTPVGLALDVNVNMNGGPGGPGCDASGGYFDFFP